MSQGTTKKTLYHFHSLARALIVPALLVLLNVLVIPVSWRWDLTADQEYTLNAATRRILTELKNPLTIEVFFSRELPNELIGVRQDVLDVVGEYQRVGRGKVILQVFDPKTSPSAAEEANRLGVPEVQFNKTGVKKLEISSGYAGLAIRYLEKSAPLPVINATTNLEYDLTLTIRRLTRENLPRLGIGTARGEQLDPNIRQALAQEYQLVDVDFDWGKLKPSDIDGLLIVGPTMPYSEDMLFALDQFVMGGGKLIVLQDGVTVQETFTAQYNPFQLNDLLSAYGVTINQDVLADTVSYEIVVSNAGNRRVLVPYPFWTKIIRSPRAGWRGINPDHPITSKLSSLTFPWPSSLTLTTSTDITITTLAETSPKTVALTPTRDNPVMLAPDALPQLNAFGTAQYPVAALVQGKLRSAFAGKPIPKNVKVKPDEVKAENPTATVLVVGNSRFLNIDFIRQAPENLAFLGNLLDALLQDTSLIAIRSRSAVRKPLREVAEPSAVQIRYANIFGGAALVVVAGIVTMILRRRTTALAIERYRTIK